MPGPIGVGPSIKLSISRYGENGRAGETTSRNIPQERRRRGQGEAGASDYAVSEKAFPERIAKKASRSKTERPKNLKPGRRASSVEAEAEPPIRPRSAQFPNPAGRKEAIRFQAQTAEL